MSEMELYLEIAKRKKVAWVDDQIIRFNNLQLVFIISNEEEQV